MLIAFTPSNKVVSNLVKIRKIAKIDIKKGSGLKIPHITIIDNSFLDIEKVDMELKRFAKSFKPFSAKIKGIGLFVVKNSIGLKKYKQKDSLIYLVKNNNSLIKFREELLKKLDYLKTDDRLKQFMEENPKLSNRNLMNIKKYGSPFGLKEWKFHTTIGLIPRKKKEEIMEKIKKLNLQENWEIDHFSLFVRKDGWVLFKKYYLKSR